MRIRISLRRRSSTAALSSALVLGLVACGVESSTGGSSSADAEEQEYAAFEMCKEFIKDRLKSPATAKFRNFFEDDGEVSVSGLGQGPYTVVSTVDSQNGFGALVRSSFTCTVTNTSGNSWRLDDMDFVDGGG